jgi:hypothetical protein
MSAGVCLQDVLTILPIREIKEILNEHDLEDSQKEMLSYLLRLPLPKQEIVEISQFMNMTRMLKFQFEQLAGLQQRSSFRTHNHEDVSEFLEMRMVRISSVGATGMLCRW